jgi:hypothetical protein
VDSIPSINFRGVQTDSVNRHGFSYRLEYGSRGASLRATYGQSDSIRNPSFLDFVAPLDSSNSFKNGEYSVQVPTSNTIFLNGQRSTMFSSQWNFNQSQLFQVPDSTKAIERLRIPISLHYKDVQSRLSITSPLVPLTFPRQVNASFGNVIKCLSDPHNNPSQFPASKELTEGINGILETFKTKDFIVHDPLEVYAVIIPASSHTRLVLNSNNLFLSQHIQSRQSEWLSTIWEAASEFILLQNRYHIQELLLNGATVHRVVGGGGEWGAKAGLITLDPVSATGSSSTTTDRGSDQLDLSLGFNLPSVAPIGSYIQFVAVIPGLSDHNRYDYYQHSLESIAADFTQKDGWSRYTTCLGRVRDESTPIYNSPTHDEITSQSSAEHLRQDQHSIIHDRHIFGALSTEPLTLKLETRDKVGREKSNTAILDVPDTHINFIQFCKIEKAEKKAASLMDKATTSITLKLPITDAETPTQNDSGKGKAIHPVSQANKAFGNFFKPYKVKRNSDQQLISKFVAMDRPISRGDGIKISSHLQHKPIQSDRKQPQPANSTSSQTSNSGSRLIKLDHEIEKSNEPTETPMTGSRDGYRLNFGRASVPRSSLGPQPLRIRYSVKPMTEVRTYSTFINTIPTDDLDNKNQGSADIQVSSVSDSTAMHSPHFPTQESGHDQSSQFQQEVQSTDKSIAMTELDGVESDSMLRISLFRVAEARGRWERLRDNKGN